ncbi:MAG: hypothetical protein C0467_05845 [Planctomycetaceae bacterium]|nr:hypothetical protein [Planctomycetaceae bacterium]
MAKKAAVNTDELVKQALQKLLASDVPLRFTGKGEHQALFASTAGANKDVIARIKDEAKPLVAEVGIGKTATVQLTAAGFAFVVESLPEDKVGVAAKQIALGLPLAERISFLQEIVRRTPPAAAELLPVIEAATVEELAAVEKHAKEAAEQRKRDTVTLEAIERWKQVIESRRAARIAALQQELAAEGAEPEELPQRKAAVVPVARTAEPGTQPVPSTPEEIGFQRQVARRLVSSWLETWDPDKPEVRQFLEAAIWNVSEFRQVGDVGQEVKFDGKYHEGGAGLFTNSAAKVVRPGWVLQEADDGEYVLAKAQVVAR